MEQNQTSWHANVQVGKSSGPSSGRIIAGIAIVAIGVAFLLEQFDILSIGGLVGTWWPVVLMLIAISQITTRPSNNWFGSMLLFAVGAIFLANNLDYLPNGFWSTFWPVLIILIGVSVLLGAKKKASHRTSGANPLNADFNLGSAEESTIDDSSIKRTAVFSGLDITSSSQAFEGGSLTAVFAGIELDLRNAVSGSNAMLIEVTSIFAGVEIRVPPTWQVITTGSPIFGGIENRTIGRMPNSDIQGPILTIRTNVIFGGIEIRH